MTQTNQVETVVQPLIEALQESEQFYRTAAANAMNSKLHDLFQERAGQRATFAQQLGQYSGVEVEEADPEQVMGFIHRGMMTIRAAMTIEHDKTDKLVLDESAAAEDNLLAAYHTALTDKAISPGLARLIQEQYRQIKAAHSYSGAVSQKSAEPLIVGLFSDTLDVQQAIDALTAQGIPREQIGVVAEEGAVTAALTDTEKEMALEGAGAGAVGGGVLGGLIGLVLGTAMTVAFGPVLILGIPALAGTTAVGTAVGVSHGALFGALLGWGMGEEDVQTYVKGVREGQILLVVRAPSELSSAAATILKQANGDFVAARSESFSEAVS